MTIACPDCGVLEDLPPLAPRTIAVCRLCRADLEAIRGRNVTAVLLCALATFVLLFPANALPLISVSLFGMHGESRLSSGVSMLWDHHWVLLAALTCAFAIVFPFLRFGLLSAVLAALRLGYRPKWLGRGFRWATALDPWAMPDVFLLGCFVGYSRLEQAMPVTIGPGGYCFIAAAFLGMAARSALDRRAVWRAIAPETHAIPGVKTLSCPACDLVRPLECEGESCPRCGAKLRARKPDSLVRTTAFIAAALVLYFPANILPMNVAVQMGTPVTHTIFNGIQLLFQAGLWPLGVLIFCTSIAIPILKIAGLGWCVASVHWRSRRHLVAKTKLYRFITGIGRWSNVDPFTIAVFVPLMQFGSLATADAAPGSTAFILVVVLTMLGARAFDPRLIWDAAEEARK